MLSTNTRRAAGEVVFGRLAAGAYGFLKHFAESVDWQEAVENARLDTGVDGQARPAGGRLGGGGGGVRPAVQEWRPAP